MSTGELIFLVSKSLFCQGSTQRLVCWTGQISDMNKPDVWLRLINFACTLCSSSWLVWLQQPYSSNWVSEHMQPSHLCHPVAVIHVPLPLPPLSFIVPPATSKNSPCTCLLQSPGLPTCPSCGRQACQHDQGDPWCHTRQKALEDLLHLAWYGLKIDRIIHRRRQI